MAEKTIDAYVAKHPDWRGEVMKALHALVLETVPDAEAAIKWAQPVYSKGGPMLYFRAAAKHVTFGFWRGQELADPDGLLEGDGDRMKHLKIRSAALPTARLQAWIRQAAELNTRHGDPTRNK